MESFAQRCMRVLDTLVTACRAEFVVLLLNDCSPVVFRRLLVEFQGSYRPLVELATLINAGSNLVRIAPRELGMMEAIAAAVAVRFPELDVVFSAESLKCSFPALLPDRRWELACRVVAEGKEWIAQYQSQLLEELAESTDADSWHEYKNVLNRLCADAVRRLDSLLDGPPGPVRVPRRPILPRGGLDAFAGANEPI